MEAIGSELRERLLTLARVRLANRPKALAAFEAELALPDGGAIGARVRLLPLPGFRTWAAMGDADMFDHKLLPAIDAWAAGEPTVLPLPAEAVGIADDGMKARAAALVAAPESAPMRKLREALEGAAGEIERARSYEVAHAGFRRIAEATRRGAAVAEPARRVPLMQQNRELILEALRAAGFDPLALSPAPRGKTCPAKAAARKAVNIGNRAFGHAWQSLLDVREVRRQS